MIVCITEKPSVAKDISSILGATVRRDGYYEGNGYKVTWTYGHLCMLKEPADYCERWKRWSLGSLPMIPDRFGIKLITDRGIEHQFGVIEQLVEEADEIINCGDAGQEGELIQRWVMQKAGCVKPVKRLWISSLTDEAIRDGFKNLRPETDLMPLYMAGLCRAIGDWVLGINATRLYTLKYRSEPGQVLSIGRVQTPTLALIVQRQKEIENFVPKDTWELRTLYRGATFVAQLPAFESEETGRRGLEAVQGKELHISSIEKKKGTETPPRLFDLTSLQVECNKRYAMTAEDTLKTIQSLYEKKVTTYPRVDTTYLTEDVYPKCGKILNSLDKYSPLLAPLRGRALKKNKKVFDNSKVTDHHAIIPTGQRPPELSDPEQKVFDTIVLRFISVFYPDCKFEQTTVHASVEPDGNGSLKKTVRFKTTGKVITDYGWKHVYGLDKPGQTAEKDKEQDPTVSILPQFRKGEHGPHEPILAKKTSQPPKYFTEGTLLKAMETAGSMLSATDDEDKEEVEQLREALKANGIGRPSTRAAIIETLFRRNYIRRERKSLRATQAGIDLIDLIREDLLKSARLTGQWEKKLRMIERKEFKPEEFVRELKQMVREITYQVLSDNANRRIKHVESK